MVFTLGQTVDRPRETSIIFDGGNSSVTHSSTQDANLQSLIVLGKDIILNGTFIETKFNDIHIERYVRQLSAQERSNIDEISKISHQILDRLESNKVAQMVYTNKIDQLNDKPVINHSLTKLCVFAVVLAMFAGIIGGASLLSNFHIVPKAYGISNISNMVDYGLVSFASVVLIGYIIAKIAKEAKPDSKTAHLSKDIDLTIRNAFLFSNLNDGTASVVYLIAALLILAPHIHLGSNLNFISKCFGYPTGILLIASGLQQVGESGIELKNSFKKKNLLNLVRGLAVIFMGYLFIRGFQSHGVGVGANWLLNVIPFAVVGMTLLAVSNELKALKGAAEKNDKSKRFFLEETLSLNEAELSNLKTKIMKWDDTEVLKWVKKQNSFLSKMLKLFNIESEHAKFWIDIQTEITSIERLQTERLAQINKMIIREEIKLLMMKKIDAFAEKIEKDTLENVLKLMQSNSNEESQPSSTALKIDDVFKKVVKESTQKRNVERAKAIILTAFLIAPLYFAFSFLSKIIVIVAYNLSQVVLNIFNIVINSTPRFRNIPTAHLDTALNVNAAQLA